MRAGRGKQGSQPCRSALACPVIKPPLGSTGPSTNAARNCVAPGRATKILKHGIGLPYHVHVENTPRHRRLSATKTRPTGVVERALAWAGRGARREHRTSHVSPDLVARKWGNCRPATKKPP